VETGQVVSALVVAQELNSPTNWEGRPRWVARRRQGLEVALGKIPLNYPGGQITQLGKPMARKDMGGHCGFEQSDRERRERRDTRCETVWEQAEAKFPWSIGFGTRSSRTWIFVVV